MRVYTSRISGKPPNKLPMKSTKTCCPTVSSSSLSLLYSQLKSCAIAAMNSAEVARAVTDLNTFFRAAFICVRRVAMRSMSVVIRSFALSVESSPTESMTRPMTFMLSAENIVTVRMISLPERIAAERSVAREFCCVSRITRFNSFPASILFASVPIFAPPFFCTCT